MPKISACIISFNKEQTKEEYLKALEHVTDEIVVVDALNTYRTIKIAYRYTEKTYDQRFPGKV